MKKNTALGTTPLSEEDAIMDRTFYRHQGRPAAGAAGSPSLVRSQPAKEKPAHYKIVSISLYNEDIENLERLVAELKAMGHTKANKSQLIRYALSTVDISDMPKMI